MCPVGLCSGHMPAVRLPTAAARASGLQYPMFLRSVIISAGRSRYTIVLQTPFLPSRHVLVAANSRLDRSSGVPSRTEKPCGDRGRAVLWRPPPQGCLWSFCYITTVILPVRWPIPSRFYHSPHQTPRLTPQPSILSFVPLSRLALIFSDGLPPHGEGTDPFRASHLVDARAVHCLSSGAGTKHL